MRHATSLLLKAIILKHFHVCGHAVPYQELLSQSRYTSFSHAVYILQQLQYNFGSHRSISYSGLVLAKLVEVKADSFKGLLV